MAFDTPPSKNLSQTPVKIAAPLLDWYDKNARDLPWRVGPAARRAGVRSDPYAVWLSEIMLQQTTVATVAPRYEAFLARWPDVRAMAAAPLDEITGQWAGLGYYARARNLHKCACIVASGHGGDFPDTEEALRKLPGIGEYTAAAIAAIAFDRPAVVVDGNIERVVSRLYAIETPLPKAKSEIKVRAAEIWPQQRGGDFAQSLMDLGAVICKPKAPLCGACPVGASCAAYKLNRAEAFPVKTAKEKKPHRCGAVFVLQNSKGDLLFERRPEKGLLGGMLGLPGTPWAQAAPDDIFASAPANTKWEKTGDATHTFTHFHLALDIFTARAPKGFRRGPNQQWIAPDKAQLPTVMRKCVTAIA